jgi:mRNA-degrading endonuclease YafQ of YafQ-DinJ toxin-antitoxin module
VAKAKPKTPNEASSPPPPLILETTTQFERDLKRQEKRGKSLDKVHAIIETLRNRRPLDLQYRDYLLGGELNDCIGYN